MLVFISWSGERSRLVAEALRIWLKDMLQALDPWVSSEDIRIGARWNLDVARRLEEAKYGILCLTRENISEPWLLFETGALAKTLDQSQVCPYLIDLKPSELTGPLVQFQAAQSTEADTRKLILSMNKALGSAGLLSDQIERSFGKWWPELNRVLQTLPKKPPASVSQLRTERDLLEEILDRIRQGDLYQSLSLGRPQLINTLQGNSIFDGPDIAKLFEKMPVLGRPDDANAPLWCAENSSWAPSQLDGYWFTRWNGGSAGKKWVSGVAWIQTFEHYLYAITHDGRADCLIAARQLENGKLMGRYVNLQHSTEVLAWVGRVMSNDRIDGIWTQGRWDLRRAIS